MRCVNLQIIEALVYASISSKPNLSCFIIAEISAWGGRGVRRGRRVDGAVGANEAGVGEGNARLRGRGRSYWIAMRGGRTIVARRQGEGGSPDHLVGVREGGLAGIDNAQQRERCARTV
jgi:hypothetical protein